MTISSELPPDLGFERAGLWSNEGRYGTALYARAFFPFLPGIATDESVDVNMRYFDRPPRLAVDWQNGQISGIRQQATPQKRAAFSLRRKQAIHQGHLRGHLLGRAAHERVREPERPAHPPRDVGNGADEPLRRDADQPFEEQRAGGERARQVRMRTDDRLEHGWP